jgi:hypothetical protein
MRRFTPITLLALLVLILGPAAAFAQPPGKPTDTSPTPASNETTPTPGAEGPQIAIPTQPATSSPAASAPRLDLAAMVLDSTLVPEGYTLFYEVYIPGSRISADLTGGAISQEEIDSAGLQWYYESVYISADGNTRLRSYVEQYADEDGAIAGFGLLEDETRLAPPGSSFTDGPGAGVGEEPSEISEGSLQPSGTPPVITSVDSTFRTGNLLAGVSVDTVPGVTADRQIAVDLSAVLFDRIQTVRANQPVPLIDYALPGQFVTLGPDWSGRDEGYLTATEIYGPDAGATLAPSFVSGYFTNESPATSDAAFPVPLVSLNISRFADESGPLQVFNMPGRLAPPFDGATPLDIDPIPGSSITQAWSYLNPLLSSAPGATADSIRITMAVGSDLVILDIQANKTLDGARDAAIQIATAQVACLQSTSPCQPLALPAGLLESPPLPATPTAAAGPVG